LSRRFRLVDIRYQCSYIVSPQYSVPIRLVKLFAFLRGLNLIIREKKDILKQSIAIKRDPSRITSMMKQTYLSDKRSFVLIQLV